MRDHAGIAILGLLALGGSLWAAQARAIEEPAVFSAQAIWGERVKGPHYRIDEDVQSDGLYRHYHFITDEGSFDVVGDQLMAVRLNEYKVYQQLNEDSGLAQFMRSFGSSALAPFRFGGQLITSPIDTVKNSANGIGNFFDSMSASSENKDPERESFMGGVLGTDAARREIASDVGVDPYTDFPPLAKRLHELAAASGIGGLSLRGAMAVIPGGAALPSVTATTTRTMVFTASSVGAAQALKEALRNKTAGQIVRDSRATLIAATHRPSIVALFLDNPNYTPADMLVMAAAFEKIHAQDSALFLAQCASAKDRTQAYHYRLQAEMYAGLKAALSFDHFVAEGQFIAMQLRDKRFVWAVPADYFVWTADNEGTVSVVGHALNAKWAAESATKNTTTKTNASSASASKSQKKKMILVVTGDFTAEARKELAKNGWEPARMTLLATPAEPSKN